MLRVPAKTVGIAWYRREAYAEARGVMEDAQVLPVDYDTWLRTAELIVLLEEAKGSEVIRATIDPPVFAAWCRATGRRPNVHARTRHVNLVIDDYCAAMRALRAGEEDEPRDVEEKITSGPATTHVGPAMDTISSADDASGVPVP